MKTYADLREALAAVSKDRDRLQRAYDDMAADLAARTRQVRDLQSMHETKLEWISMKDRMPDNCEDVLIFRGVKGSVFVGRFTNPCFGADYAMAKNIRYRHDITKVTHWMPLPEPPQEAR